MVCESKQLSICSHLLYMKSRVTKSTLERLEKGKQKFEARFDFIGSKYVNRIFNNNNAKNTFKLVKKGLFFKLHLYNIIYLRELTA